MTLLIVGATSAIAHQAARAFAAEGAALALAARSPDKRAAVAADLAARGAAAVHELGYDALDPARWAAVVDEATAALGQIDMALVAHGAMPPAAELDRDPEAAARAFTVNATSVVATMTAIAAQMERQGFGTLAVVSSVAGDRGRPSNAVYTSAKAAVSQFAGALRARLHGAGVRVVTVKPGPVDTPMLEGVDRPAALVASPERVGRRVHRAMRRGEAVVYTPGYWRAIMAAVRAVPETVFKRLQT